MKRKTVTYKIQKVKEKNGGRPCNSSNQCLNSVEQSLQNYGENLFAN